MFGKRGLLILGWLGAFLVWATPALPVEWAWTDRIGSGGADQARAILQTSDGGYLIAGSTGSFGLGSLDGWACKLTAGGTIQWQKTYGGFGGEAFNAVIAGQGGGYLAIGYTDSFGAGVADLWALKLNENGTVAWQKTFGGYAWEEGFAAARTNDGGYLLVGQAQSFGAGGFDLWALKIDGSGNIVWQEALGGPSNDGGQAVLALADGSFIVGGYTASFGAGAEDVWVMKIQAAGAVTWQKAIGGSTPDSLSQIVQASNGDILLGGLNEDFWTAKIDAGGTLVWQRAYGGTAADNLFGLYPTSDGGYLLAGTSYSFGQGAQAWAVRATSSGSIAWQAGFGSTDEDQFLACIQTADGGYALAGFTYNYGAVNRDAWLFKLNSSGALGGSCTGGTGTAGTMKSVSLVSAATVVGPAITAASGAATVVTPSDSLFTPVNCTAQGPLTAIASADYTTGPVPLTVQFTGAVIGGSPPYTIDWDFGDGTPHSTLANPSHTYTEAGSFPVALKATDKSAATSTDSHLVIQVTSEALTCQPSAAPASGTAPLAVALSPGVSGGTPPITYSWDFKDGSSPSAEESPVHIFGTAGSYAVKLTATDASEATASGTVTVSVSPSPPCMTWNKISSTGEDLQAVCWGGGRYAATGVNILTSPDGLVWTTQVADLLDFYDIAYGGGYYVAVGSWGAIFVSSNGIDWVDYSLGTSPPDFYAVAYGNGLFVAMAQGMAYTGTGAGAWTRRDIPTAGTFRDVIWNGSQFVAVGSPSGGGDTAPIFTSPNGTAWTSRDSQTLFDLESVVWDGSRFVAVGHEGATSSGIVLGSPDGAAWSVLSNPAGHFKSVAWNGQMYYAVGTSGLIQASANATTWTAQPSGTTKDLNEVNWNGSQLVAVGRSGTILQSTGADSCLSVSPTATPGSGSAPLEVTFESHVRGGAPPYTYRWDFGDGSPTSSLAVPKHTYLAAGSYSATLLLIDAVSHGAAGQVSVGVSEQLQVAASASPTSGTPPVEVTFTSQVLNGTPPFTYSWDFGDGSAPSAEANPVHTYSYEGNYTASLTVTDAMGLSGTSAPIVLNFSGAPCTVSCTAEAPATAVAGTGAAFGSTATSENCPGVLTFSWSFGDGGTSNLQSPSHVYASAGTFTWTLTVAIFDQTCIRTGSVQVAPACGLACTATVPATALAGTPLAFAASATPSNCTGSVNFAWDFDDGSTSSEQNPTHAYAAGGAYTWRMTASVSGTTCMQTGTIQVTEPCSLDCSVAAPGAARPGTAASFLGSVTPHYCTGTPDYAWDFGDGSTSSELSPSHTYASVGSYTWTFTAALEGATCTRTGTLTVWDSATWVREYGPGLEMSDMAPTPDGGYVFVGYYWADVQALLTYLTVLKVDSAGGIVWQKYYSNPKSGGYRVRVAPDGGIFVTGEYYDGGYQGWVLHLGASGQLLWQRVLSSGAYLTHLQGADLEITPQGDLLLAGNSIVAIDYHLYLMKMSGQGAILWSRRVDLSVGGNPLGTSVNAIVRTHDDNYLVLASTGYSIWVAKIDGEGTILQQTFFKLPAGVNLISAQDIRETADGGAVVVGYIYTAGSGDPFGWILRLDPSGQILWQNQYSAAFGLNGAWPLADGGFLAVGTAQRDPYERDTLLWKMDGSGNFLWQKKYPLQSNTYAHGGVREAGDGSLLLWDTFFARVAPDGEPPDSCSATQAMSAQPVATSLSILASAVGTPDLPAIATDPEVAAYDSPFASTVVCSSGCWFDLSADADPNTGGVPLEVHFTASVEGHGCTGGAAFSWNFGDGQTSAAQNPVHTYGTAGTYGWTLAVTLNGQVQVRSGQVFVNAPCEIACEAVVPAEAVAGSQVPFSASATVSGCSDSPSYFWTFGDEWTSPEEDPSHAYGSPGIYTWTLTVSAGGATCTRTGTIQILAGCTLDCAASAPAAGTPGTPVAFTGSATPSNCSGQVSFAWDFGDGAASAEQSPSHAYAAAGTYAWTFAATVDDISCTQAGTIEVSAACSLSCTANVPGAGVAGTAVAFAASATPSDCALPVSFAWAFGDGGTSSEQNPGHVYAAAGSFSWTLTATADGVPCTQTGTITIAAPGGMPGDCNGDGKVAIGEVQRAINMFLGTQAVGCNVDCNGNGTVAIGEVQKVINVFLGTASGC